MSASDQAIFLSYASQDAEAAGHICNALRAAGLEVWFDQNELRGGDARDASIRRRSRVPLRKSWLGVRNSSTLSTRPLPPIGWRSAVSLFNEHAA